MRSNDYVMSNAIAHAEELGFCGKEKETLVYCCTVHEELLRSSWEEVLKKYSDWDSFFYQEYGLDEKKITHFQEFSGKGVEVQLNQNNIVMGNSKLMQEKGISFDSVNSIGNVVYVAQDKKYIGYLIISDQIKQSALSLVKDLKEIGIKKVVMLSGDKLENVQKVSQKIGINHYFAELLPLQKVEKIKLLKKEGIVAFVGDGINDAPVLKMSDVGISMGSVGSDAAIEASDVVLMHDNLEKIRTSILIAKMTRKIVKFNILFAILAKVLILLLGIVGVTTVWLAVFADVGVTILTILNTLRIMVKKVK